jgi:3-oxoacyl-[acyl-carrier-protein] synthase-3
MTKDSTKRRAAITGTGRFLGDRVIKTEELLEAFHIDPAKIADPELEALIQKSYPVRRRVQNPELSTSSLFIEAGKKALAASGVSADEVSLLICVTDTPDYISPATAARVQHGLGAMNAGFFDLNAACSGFSAALVMGSNFIRCTPDARAVLVIGGNLYSKYLPPDDFASQLLFSDGAGAVVLTPAEEGIRESAMAGDGQYWDRWGVYAGGTWKGFSPEVLAQGYHQLRRWGTLEHDINVRKWPPVIETLLKKSGWAPSEINRAFLTQSRRRPIQAICDQLGWHPSISYDTADRYGYLGSACIPVALDDAIQNGVLHEGEKILILSSGIGYSCWALTTVWGQARSAEK